MAHLCTEGILASHTPDREPRLHHSLTVCPWASYLATLGLSFLIYKVGLMQRTSFQGDPEDGSDNTHGGSATPVLARLPAGGFALVDRAIALALSPTPRPPGGKVLSGTLSPGCGRRWGCVVVPPSSSSTWFLRQGPRGEGMPCLHLPPTFPRRQAARVQNRRESGIHPRQRGHRCSFPSDSA